MAEASVTPEASVASTGKGIRYIGSGEVQHCYAWSGTQAVSASISPKEVLNFTTGAGYIVGNFYYQLDTTNLTAGNEVGYSVTINGKEIALAKGGEPAGSGLNTVTTPFELKLIIPPLSLVVVNLISVDPDSMTMGMTFAGRVYGAQ